MNKDGSSAEKTEATSEYTFWQDSDIISELSIGGTYPYYSTNMTIKKAGYYSIYGYGHQYTNTKENFYKVDYPTFTQYSANDSINLIGEISMTSPGRDITVIVIYWGETNPFA